MNQNMTRKSRGFDAEWAAELANMKNELMRSTQERFKQRSQEQADRLSREERFEDLVDAAQAAA